MSEASISDSVRREYADTLPLWTRLEEEVLFTIGGALKPGEIRIHEIGSRIKSLESVDRKLRTKGYEALGKLNDIVGFRVVCLFLPDIERLRQLLGTEFDIVLEDDKLAGLPPYDFRYLSHHLVCKLRKENVGRRYEGLKELQFEIQIRTITMDAWASISHHLQYKAETDIPDNLKRDFHALNGLFYVADKHFEMFFQSKEEAQTSIGKALREGREEIPLTTDSLQVLLTELYPERVAADGLQYLSDLLSDVLAAGYNSVSSLRDDLVRANEALLAYEEADPPIDTDTRKKTTYAPVGAVRTAMGLLGKRRRTRTEPANVLKFRKLIKNP